MDLQEHKGNGKGISSLAQTLNGAGLKIETQAEVKAEQVESIQQPVANQDDGFVFVKDNRPRILSNDAFQKRRKDIEEAIRKKEAGDPKPYKCLIAVVHWDRMHEDPELKGRESNPLTVLEYEEYKNRKLTELPEDFGKLQFTKRANKRVSESVFEDELRGQVFHGRFNVDLLEVEKAIILLEQKAGEIRGIMADGDELVTCHERTGGGICAREFLPRRYFNHAGKYRGNWGPDILDEKAVPVCQPCKIFLMDVLTERNKNIIAACEICREMDQLGEDGRHNDHAGDDPKNMTALPPRFLCKQDADKAVRSRLYAKKCEAEEKEAEKEVEAQRERNSAADRFIQRAVERTRYNAAIPRGVNKKHRGETRRQRDRDYFSNED